MYSRENGPGRYITREPRDRGTDDDTGRHHRLGHRGRAPDDLVPDPDAPDLEPDAPDAEDAPIGTDDAPADGSPRHEGPGADRG